MTKIEELQQLLGEASYMLDPVIFADVPEQFDRLRNFIEQASALTLEIGVEKNRLLAALRNAEWVISGRLHSATETEAVLGELRKVLKGEQS